jgi:tetratricopeptide (TPR) repeat protein
MECLEDYQKAIELDPEDVVALKNLGLIEEKIGKIESSKNRFKQTDTLLKDEKFERPDFINELLKDAKPITQEEFELNNRVFEQNETKTTLKFKNHIETIKHVLTSKEGRQEFFNFLKGEK